MNATFKIRWFLACSFMAVVALLLASASIVRHVSGGDDAAVRNRGDDDQPEVPHIIMVLKEELEQMLAKTHPKATVRLEDNSLIAEFDVRKYSVHGMGKDAEATEGLFERVGPTARGFVVKLWSTNHKYVAQASGAAEWGEFRKLYWNKYINEYKIHNENKYVHLQIDYGGFPDTKTLDAIVRMVMRHGEPTFITPWDNQPSRWGGN